MTSPVQNININLEVDVLTVGSVGIVVNEILEFLLYQRNQIPIVYKTFKYYVGKWTDTQDDEAYTSRQFQLQRQREMATRTKDSISEMRELIRHVFQNHVVRSLRFLFGATAYTPKEVYTIHVPMASMTRLHFHEQHSLSHSRINQTLISLITREELYAIFSNVMPTTNVFLELELLDDLKSSIHPYVADTQTIPQVFPKDISKLPNSCKQVHFNLLHTRPVSLNDMPKCCKATEVFDDLKPNEDEIELLQRNECLNTIFDDESNIKSAWWEADIVVRGFKDQPSKAFSVWNS